MDQPTTASSVGFLTFNVWNSPKCVDQRAAALVGLIGSLDPDVVALQEVTPKFLGALKKSPKITAEYHMTPVLRPRGYFVVLMSKFTLLTSSRVRFANSTMEREFVRVDFLFLFIFLFLFFLFHSSSSPLCACAGAKGSN